MDCSLLRNCFFCHRKNVHLSLNSCGHRMCKNCEEYIFENYRQFEVPKCSYCVACGNTVTDKSIKDVIWSEEELLDLGEIQDYFQCNIDKHTNELFRFKPRLNYSSSSPRFEQRQNYFNYGANHYMNQSIDGENQEIPENSAEKRAFIEFQQNSFGKPQNTTEHKYFSCGDGRESEAELIFTWTWSQTKQPIPTKRMTTSPIASQRKSFFK